jgi:hypothetical protein
MNFTNCALYRISSWAGVNQVNHDLQMIECRRPSDDIVRRIEKSGTRMGQVLDNSTYQGLGGHPTMNSDEIRERTQKVGTDL